MANEITRARIGNTLDKMLAEMKGTADVMRSMCPPTAPPYLVELDERITVLESILRQVHKVRL